MPIPEAIGGRALRVGDPPAGTAAELLTNMLCFVYVVAVSESLALGAATGISPDMSGVKAAMRAARTAQHSWARASDFERKKTHAYVADDDAWAEPSDLEALFVPAGVGYQLLNRTDQRSRVLVATAGPSIGTGLGA
ncbi:MAG: hypothetical protein ACYCST_11755 [Acidimicrobiales bacterium]